MAESSNYSRSVVGGSDEDYSRSVLGGSDVDYTRSVMGGSDEDYSRFVMDGSDEDYSRSVLGGSDEHYSRSVLGGSDEDYSRSVMGGSDEHYSRSVLGGSDEDYSRSVLGGSVVDYCEIFSNDSGSVKEYPCEPCHNVGKNTSAVKYCIDCSEYLCGPCCEHHMKFKALRHHVIKDVEAGKPVVNKDSTKVIDKSTERLAKLDISEEVEQRPGHVTSSSGATRNVTANLESTIDVSTSKDNGSPHINDLTVVQTHYCVVIDWYNESVKVVDTRTRCVTSQIQLSDGRYGYNITSVNDDQVAVAANITGVRTIPLFSVSAFGIISDTHKSIGVKYARYSCITHSNDRFYASTSSRIEVIGMQNQIITTFTNKSFRRLSGIALSNDHNTLYVCSCGNDTVFRVDLNGNVTASYNDNDLEIPTGITVDSDGYVYVCSPGTRCVHQLTADLNKGQVIIKDVDVLSCVFNKNNNSLYLVTDNTIQVYSLTYT